VCGFYEDGELGAVLLGSHEVQHEDFKDLLFEYGFSVIHDVDSDTCRIKAWAAEVEVTLKGGIRQGKFVPVVVH
jgi:hypothetical protein